MRVQDTFWIASTPRGEQQSAEIVRRRSGAVTHVAVALTRAESLKAKHIVTKGTITNGYDVPQRVQAALEYGRHRRVTMFLIG